MFIISENWISSGRHKFSLFLSSITFSWCHISFFLGFLFYKTNLLELFKIFIGCCYICLLSYKCIFINFFDSAHRNSWFTCSWNILWNYNYLFVFFLIWIPNLRWSFWRWVVYWSPTRWSIIITSSKWWNFGLNMRVSFVAWWSRLWISF